MTRTRDPKRYLSQLKIHDLFPKRQDRRCRCGCEAELTGRRTSWASKECEAKALEHFLITKGDCQAIRKAVLRRDHSACQICHTDTERARDICRRWRDHRLGEEDNARRMEEAGQQRAHYMARGFPSPHETWFQVDHIKPVIEGGTHCMENFRTLCIPCHAIETGKLASRRARERRENAAAARLERFKKPLLPT